MNASSSAHAGDNSSIGTADPASTTGSFMEEFAGAASQFGGAASQVTGAAANVAADVASGVAAGVAAGLGWINSSTVPSGSIPTSSNDTAIVPDVIIDNQGVWSPMGGYMNRGGYGVSASYGNGGWTGQPQMGGYGQPYVDQGFTGVYQRDAAGFGTGRYAGPGFSQQDSVAAGFPAANGFSVANHPGSWGDASPADSRVYSASTYYNTAGQQHDDTSQTNPSWQTPGTGANSTAAGHTEADIRTAL